MAIITIKTLKAAHFDWAEEAHSSEPVKSKVLRVHVWAIYVEFQSMKKTKIFYSPKTKSKVPGAIRHSMRK